MDTRNCDTCGSVKVAQIREGQTRSNKGGSIKYVCPDGPHNPSTEPVDDGDVDLDSLKSIAQKYAE